MEYSLAMIGLAHPIPFCKMTGSGNDFILIDNRSQSITTDQMPILARLACRRKLSLGADGLILVETDPEVDFMWRFFNADGSEAEMCGNGARCAARFVHLQGIVRKQDMAFRTLAGIIRATIMEERVKVQMTTPRDLQMDIFLQLEDGPFDLHAINTGVPHVVLLVADKTMLEGLDVFRLGRALRYHSRFQPAGTNANFAVIRDQHHLVIRTYERGVEAETLACGTGSIAATLIAAARKLVTSPVEVLTQSGETLVVHFRQSMAPGVPEFTEVHLEGDAKVVCTGKLWDETLRE